MLHFQGHMTCDKILALLKGIGGVISKRQVVRLLTARLETFQAQDAAVLNPASKARPMSRSTTPAPTIAGQGPRDDPDRLLQFRRPSHRGEQIAPGVS
jgi:hypothetical protein